MSAEQWKREQVEKQQRTLEPLPESRPPDDGAAWLDPVTASFVADVNGRRKWWFRRSHTEEHAAARALVRRYDRLPA